MTHPIIKTDNYLLVVDELSDVKYENIGDIWNEIKDRIIKTYEIFAHLPLNNAPTLEGVPLLPPLEDESNIFAEQETIKNEWNSEKWFRCPNCKDEEIRRLQKFCSNCGNKFNWHEGSIIQGRL